MDKKGKLIFAGALLTAAIISNGPAIKYLSGVNKPSIVSSVQQKDQLIIPSAEALAQNTEAMRLALREKREAGEFSDNKLEQKLGKPIESIDPILVGRNIIFSDDWLDLISARGKISKENFETWRDRMDYVIDGYAWLTGHLPVDGQRYKVSIRDSEHIDMFAYEHIHGDKNDICFSENSVGEC